MKTFLRLTIALAAALVVLEAAPVHAQGIGISINPYVGAYHFDESSFEDAVDETDLDSGAIYGLRVGLGGHEGFSLDLAYGRTSVEGRFVIGNVVFEEDSGIDLYYGALDWHLPVPVVDVFASGGLGAIRYSPEDRDAQTNVLVNYGAGISVPVVALRLRADIKDHVDLCDAPDDITEFDFGACLEDEALHNIEVSAGVEIPL